MAEKRVFTVAAADPGRLDELIAARLGMARAEAARLVAEGAVALGGRPATDPGLRAPPGTRVVVRLLPSAAAPALAVRLRDDWLLVIDKPAGVPSQGTPGHGAGGLDAQVRALEPEARLVHRLDRDASGLVLFSRTAAARAPLHQALAQGRIDRRYRAIAGGRLTGEGTIALRIARTADPRRRVALPERAPGGEPARSHWRALAQAGEHTALEVTLDTGRTHQIRVHLSAIGHPVVGDRLYGGAPAPRLMLHATELELVHPGTGARLVVRSPVPAALAI
jgi:23S rRNA pseudouridine1911/1915/1917 synthase